MHWKKGPNAEEIWSIIKPKLKGRKSNSGCFKKGHKNPWEGRSINWVGCGGLCVGGLGKLVGLNVSIRCGFPNICEKCGFQSDNPNKLHWANKSHKYKRDVKDWMRLCVPCHKKYDLAFLGS